ncbi:MAG: hypothetical protein OEY59_09530 [Deltaproteobacteria bacterium]|nr:hypothetical protein [Deltaproteobacteria bacterium]
MQKTPTVEPYNIIAEEKISYSYFTALQTIFYNYVSQLESYLYDELGIVFKLRFNIESGIKFKDVFQGLDFPLPILIYELSPLGGDSLLIMENSSANFLLQKEELKKNKKTVISNLFHLEKDNFPILKTELERLLKIFENCWDKITISEAKIKKLVTHKLKAKIMNPVETCVLVNLQISHKAFQTQWVFCFSGYQLDPIMKKFGKKALLAGNGDYYQDESNKNKLEEMFSKEINYEAKGILGELEISHEDLLESYRTKKVLPLSEGIMDNIIIKLNGVPTLSAQAGKTHDQVSLKVNGIYEEIKSQVKKRQKPFLKTDFPTS